MRIFHPVCIDFMVNIHVFRCILSNLFTEMFLITVTSDIRILTFVLAYVEVLYIWSTKFYLYKCFFLQCKYRRLDMKEIIVCRLIPTIGVFIVHRMKQHFRLKNYGLETFI